MATSVAWTSNFYTIICETSVINLTSNLLIMWSVQ